MGNSVFNGMNNMQNNQKMPFNKSDLLNFAKSLGNKNPKNMVEELLKNGKMSNEQFEQLKSQADMFMNLIK